MIKNEATYQLIEQYLNGQFSAEESLVFEQKIKADAELAKAVCWLKEIKKQGTYKEDKKVLEQLDRLGKQYFVPPKVRRIAWTKIAAVAASLLLILLTVFLIQPRWNTDSLLSQTPIDITEMGIGDLQLSKGQANYDDGNYAHALAYFNEYLKVNPSNIEVMEAAGLCYLHLEETERAAATFQQILNSNATEYFKDNARWYLALNAYKADDLVNCKSYLKLLQENSSSRHLKKADLLKKRL